MQMRLIHPLGVRWCACARSMEYLAQSGDPDGVPPVRCFVVDQDVNVRVTVISRFDCCCCCRCCCWEVCLRKECDVPLCAHVCGVMAAYAERLL